MVDLIYKNSNFVFNPSKYAFFLRFNRFEIQYSGVFEVANYESELRI